ncbi:hypothetical protein [Pseudomonas asiatica]|uniref:hypothetical protein n=1 Tax=Pseudomonas asiatica TaxID=2219225 RepID=UPI0025A4A0FE|nr:hypothetical protein [Pseudomonas asiatica]WJN52460.1 hypothetical protein QUR91_11870 [Pseudomonas asiatica]
MSYEYKLVFEEPKTLQNLFDKLLESGACTKRSDYEIHIKDPKFNSIGSYDARLQKCDDTRAWLEILFPTPYLYGLFSTFLSDAKFRCLEDGDEGDEVSLKQAFRVRNI